MSSNTRVHELADVWLAAANDWSTGTERTYRSMVKTQIKPVLGDLRLREVTAGVVSRALAATAER